MGLPEGTKLYLMAPVNIEVGQRFETLWDDLRTSGFIRVRINGETHSLDNPPAIDRRRRHDLEVVIDRVIIKEKERSRISESIEAALAMGRGVLHVVEQQSGTEESRWPLTIHSQHLACQSCGQSFQQLTPHSFSFNSQLGWCSACEGLGTQVGANPAALLRDTRKSLAEGVVLLWPDVSEEMSRQMLDALSQATGIQVDRPFEGTGWQAAPTDSFTEREKRGMPCRLARVRKRGRSSSSLRDSIRRWRRLLDFRPRYVAGLKRWSTKLSVRCVAVVACVRTRPHSGTAGSRWISLFASP